MTDTYEIVRQNRYWHVLGDGFCGTLDRSSLDEHLRREGPWDELAETMEADSAMRCRDCTFPDE